MAKCIYPNCKMYLFKIENVFVQILKCICLNGKISQRRQLPTKLSKHTIMTTNTILSDSFQNFFSNKKQHHCEQNVLNWLKKMKKDSCWLTCAKFLRCRQCTTLHILITVNMFYFFAFREAFWQHKIDKKDLLNV